MKPTYYPLVRISLHEVRTASSFYEERIFWVYMIRAISSKVSFPDDCCGCESDKPRHSRRSNKFWLEKSSSSLFPPSAGMRDS
jgi:hypothetical protein